MIGCSHHSTPLEIRELLSFSDEQCGVALSRFRLQFPECECVLLNTCNRVELYVGAHDGAEMPSVDDLIRFVTGFHGQSAEQFESHFVRLEDEKAIEHLFAVASSIDSLVVGESQISSQVDEAYRRASDGGYAGSTMHAAFQHANQVS